MTLAMLFQYGYEKANQTIRDVERIEEMQTEAGTFLEITCKEGEFHRLNKHLIKRIEFIPSHTE